MNFLSVLATLFLLVSVAEAGCLLRTAAFTVRFGQPLAVFLGTLLGTALMTGLGVLLGESVHQHLPVSLLRWVSAGVFLLLGLLVATGKL